MSLSNPVWYVLALFAALLCLAGWFDLRQQRIPNRLIVAGSVIALVAHGLLPSGNGLLLTPTGGLGLLSAAAGLLLGALALLPLYAIGAMGAGDVKLLAMLGAFLGPEHIGGAVLFSLLAGGLFSIAALVVRRRLGGTIPFGIAIACGTLAYVAMALLNGTVGGFI